MSIAALNWAFAQSVTPATKKLVLIALADAADESGFCFPSYSAIVTKTSSSERSCKSAVAELLKDGLIEKSPRFRRDGTSSTNLYRLRIGPVAPDHPFASIGGEGANPAPYGANPAPYGANPAPHIIQIESKKEKAPSRLEFLESVRAGIAAGEFEEWGWLGASGVEEQARACADYWLAKGELPVGAVAAVRSWVRKGVKDGRIRPAAAGAAGPAAASGGETSGAPAQRPDNLKPWQASLWDRFGAGPWAAWFAGTDFDESANVLRCPSAFAADWITRTYGPELERLWPGVRVRFQTKQEAKK